MAEAFDWANLGPFIGLFVVALFYMARYVKSIHEQHTAQVQELIETYTNQIAEMKDAHKEEIMGIEQEHREAQERLIERLMDIGEKRAEEQRAAQQAFTENALVLASLKEQMNMFSQILDRTVATLNNVAMTLQLPSKDNNA